MRCSFVVILSNRVDNWTAIFRVIALQLFVDTTKVLLNL